MPGVSRMMLDRIGGEVARATSLVRYEPNSTFSPHVHSGGEEFLVLDGAFADEHGSYPAGSYVRNPIGTSHTPSIGPEGALILVKLQQFDPDDDRQVVIDGHQAAWEKGSLDGVAVLPLHEFGSERVRLIRIAKRVRFDRHQHDGGEEIFVVEGAIADEFGDYPAGSWLRYPHGSEHQPYTAESDALIWVKSGHLPAAFASGSDHSRFRTPTESRSPE